MGSAVPLEKSVDEDLSSKDIGQDLVYRGNRISASMQFAREVTKENSDIFLDSLKDIKGLWLINPTPLLGPVAAFATCYAFTPIALFLYSTLSLRYSKDKQGYVFDRTTRDRLSVVG